MTNKQPGGLFPRLRQRREQRRREREERRQRRIRARQRRRLRRRLFISRSVVFLGLGAAACSIGVIVVLLFGQPYPWQTFADVQASISIGRALPVNQQRWATLGIERYTVEVTYREGGLICGPATIEVANAEVVETPEGATWPAECDDIAGTLTVEATFDRLRGVTNGFRPGLDSLRADFHPDFGYPTFVRSSVYAPENRTPVCCWSGEWRNLRPIDEPTSEIED